jgi:hypothetical protein
MMAAPGPVAADIDGSRYTSSKKWGISIEAPKNWKLSEEHSYPSILLWMVRRDPQAKLLLSAEPVTDPDARSYASRTALVLTSLGFAVHEPQLHSATGAWRLDFDDGKVFLNQAFLVSGGIGYSLTLAAPDRMTRNQQSRAFDFVLRSIRIRRELRPAEPGPAQAPAPPPAPAQAPAPPPAPAQAPAPPPAPAPAPAAAEDPVP